MSKLSVVAVALCCGFVACGDEGPQGGGEKETLRMTARESDGDLAYCDKDGNCETLPNPGGCKTLVITIDTQTGKSCERCEDANGNGIERCGDTSVACQIITLPEPDCVVCAYINGAVIYSSCNPPDDDVCKEIACPAIYPVCEDGQEPRKDPNSCCGYTCPPPTCDDVMCAAFAGCPTGTERVITPGNCCGICVPKGCYSSSDCPLDWQCTTERGECLPCNAPEGAACDMACRGTCQPGYVID